MIPPIQRKTPQSSLAVFVAAGPTGCLIVSEAFAAGPTSSPSPATPKRSDPPSRPRKGRWIGPHLARFISTPSTSPTPPGAGHVLPTQEVTP